MFFPDMFSRLFPYGTQFVVALVLFFWGHRKLKLRMLAKNMGTSKLRSLAMGFVEVSGIVSTTTPFLDPIFKSACVYYRIYVEELRSSGKESHWVVVERYINDSFPFWLSDATGKVLINPRNADTDAIEKIDSGGYSQSGFFIFTVQRRRRYRYRIIPVDSPLFVLGTAKPYKEPPRPGDPVRLTDSQLAKEIKNNPTLMASIDTNHDGTISPEEWDAAFNSLRKETDRVFYEKEFKRQQAPDQVVIAQEEGQPFVISFCESDLEKRAFSGWVLMTAGAALLAFTVFQIF